MKQEKFDKLFYPFSILTFTIGSVCSGILWINNLASACRYHRILFQEGKVTKIQTGFWSDLDWSTADVSTVTTFIPFFGFILLLYAALFRKSVCRWPLFDGYEKLNISLGLLGTLWGIILIGYYPAEDVSIPALMSCLHTAMFSTLAAIIWGMVLSPLCLKPWMNAIYNAKKGQGLNHEPEILLEDCMESLSALDKRLSESVNAARDFKDILSELNNEIREVKDSEDKWKTENLQCMREITQIMESLKNERICQQKENQELRQKNQALTANLNTLNEETEKLRHRLNAIHDILR